MRSLWLFAYSKRITGSDIEFYAMNVSVNGKEHVLREEASLLSLLSELSISKDDSGIAIALDSNVIPRAAWEKTFLKPGMEIEIVRAAAGG